MAQVESHTSIVNAALAELGSTERLVSFDTDESSSARRARALWHGILRDLLYLHPWNFAIRRRMLNPGAAFDELRQYQLPEDCVRWLPDDRGGRAGTVEREGDCLVARGSEPLSCRYIAMVNDPTLWSPGFVRAMVLRLAAAMAEGVTQSEGIKDRLLDQAVAAIKMAKRMDGLETGDTRRRGVVARSDWLNSRSRAFAWRGR